jgi:hypothetical protein
MLEDSGRVVFLYSSSIAQKNVFTIRKELIYDCKIPYGKPSKRSDSKLRNHLNCYLKDYEICYKVFRGHKSGYPSL